MATPVAPVNRCQLAYVLKKASEIAEDPNVLVLGSQATFGAQQKDGEFATALIAAASSTSTSSSSGQRRCRGRRRS